MPSQKYDRTIKDVAHVVDQKLVIHWTDYSLMLDDLDNWERNERADIASYSQEHSASWSGSKDWDEAMQRARYGWKEVTKKFLAAMALPDMSSQGVAPARKVGMAGHSVHIPNFVAGLPNAMLAKGEDRHGGRRVVRLLLDRSNRSQIDGRPIINRGIAICSMVNLLEAQGVSVEVTAINTVDTDRFTYEGKPINELSTSVDVKRAGEPLNLDRMAFVCASPAYHRRMQFRARECVPGNAWPALQGYGRSINSTPTEQQIHFPIIGSASEYATVGAAKERIESIIANGMRDPNANAA